MRYIFVFMVLVSASLAIFIAANAKSALHEIEAILLVLIAIICIGFEAVLRHLKK